MAVLAVSVQEEPVSTTIRNTNKCLQNITKCAILTGQHGAGVQRRRNCGQRTKAYCPCMLTLTNGEKDG